MEKVQIEKGTLEESMVIPLYRKKICIEKFPHLFRDDYAMELLKIFEYDSKEVEQNETGKMQQFETLEAAQRQNDIEAEILEYLAENPDASVVNIGCGLDQTSEKCDNGRCKIYNLDAPDKMKFRNELIPETDRITNLDYDITDQEWFNEIDSENGVIFFASGVFSYMKREDIKNLFNAMALRFPEGRLVFDSMGKVATKMRLKNWAKENGIENIESLFTVDETRWDIRPWIKNSKISEKGYMKKYSEIKDETIPKSYRFYGKLADKVYKLKIVRLDFSGKRN